MVERWKWSPLRGARLYFGGIGLVIAFVAIGCAREAPTGVEMVNGVTANTWSVQYLCELGYPGYEADCDDFGSQSVNCPKADRLDNWAAVNADPSCGLPYAVEITEIDLNAVKTQVTNYIDTWTSGDAECADLRTRLQRVITNIRVRKEGINGAIVGQNAVSLSWGGGPAEETMIVLSHARIVQGIDKVAQTIAHEIMHGMWGLQGPVYGHDAATLSGNTTVGTFVNTEVQACTGLTN